MNGNLLQKIQSGPSPSRSIPYALELFLAVMAGALAAYMHFNLRIPLNLPGHHGIEFMAIIVLVRLSSSLKYAGILTITGTGIMLMIPGIGPGNMMHGFSYLLPGILLDIAYLAGKERIHILIFTALISGFAYMCIPLSRALVQLFTGYPYMAFIKFGMSYTILSFFFFGGLGGLLGYGLYQVKVKFNKPKNNDAN